MHGMFGMFSVTHTCLVSKLYELWPHFHHSWTMQARYSVPPSIVIRDDFQVSCIVFDSDLHAYEYKLGK